MRRIRNLFWRNDKRNLSEKILGKQTNNVAELSAIYKAIIICEESLQKNEKILIVSDSEYSIRCCTSYSKKIMIKIEKDIPNKELIKLVYENIRIFRPNIFNIFFHIQEKKIFLKRNEMADLLANKAIGVTSNQNEKIYLKF